VSIGVPLSILFLQIKELGASIFFDMFFFFFFVGLNFEMICFVFFSSYVMRRKKFLSFLKFYFLLFLYLFSFIL
jgi:hypothetical protein